MVEVCEPSATIDHDRPTATHRGDRRCARGGVAGKQSQLLRSCQWSMGALQRSAWTGTLGRRSRLGDADHMLPHASPTRSARAAHLRWMGVLQSYGRFNLLRSHDDLFAANLDFIIQLLLSSIKIGRLGASEFWIAARVRRRSTLCDGREPDTRHPFRPHQQAVRYRRSPAPGRRVGRGPEIALFRAPSEAW
jgi:hypothetical protein